MEFAYRRVVRYRVSVDGLGLCSLGIRVLGASMRTARVVVAESECSYRGADLKGDTHRPQSSSFLGFPYRILYMNPKKELLWGLWVLSTRAGKLLSLGILSEFIYNPNG